MQRRKLELIDDDPTLFDLPAEWLFPHLPRAESRADHLGLRSLAADVDLQSGKSWPMAPRRSRRHRGRFRAGGDFPDAA